MTGFSLPAALLFSFTAAFFWNPTVCTAADIVLEKNLSGDEGPPPARGETYTVRPGDSLSAILSAAGVPDDRMDEYLSALMELNPGMTDPDRIHPGEKIDLPPLPETLSEPSSGETRQSPAEPPADTGRSLPRLGTLREAGELMPLLRDALSSIDEELRDSGSISLPISSAGIVTLDNRSYPLLDLTTGRSLLVDLDGKMPQEWKERIELRWPGYRVVNAKKDGDLRSLLSDLFDESGFHSIARDSPLSIGRGGTIRVTPDFLIAKEAGSLMEGTIYLVTVDPPGSEGIPLFIRERAQEHRIEVVEVGRAGKGNGGPGAAAPRRTKKITASDLRTLVGEISSSIGLKVTQNHVHRPGGADDGEGLEVEVRADLLIEGSGRTCLLFFGPLEAWVSNLLDREGVSYVTAGLHDSLHAVLGSVLSRLHIPYSGPSVEFYRPRGRYAFALPGFYLESTRGPLLLTTEEPGPEVVSFLSSRGIDIVTCLLAP